MKNSKLNHIETYMLQNMPTSDPVHGPEHIYRVTANALEIAEHCGQTYDRNILLAACLLHDIGRVDQKKYPDRSHAQIGSQKAYSFLLSIGWDEERAERVSNAILLHSQQVNDPTDVEAQILFDADKLDTMGFIGMARLLMHAGEHGTPLYQFDENGQLFLTKYQKSSSFLQDYQLAEETAKNLYTAYARSLASEKLLNTKKLFEGLVRDITYYHDHLQNLRTSFFD